MGADPLSPDCISCGRTQVIAPHAAEIDRSNSFPSSLDLWAELGSFGLLGASAVAGDGLAFRHRYQTEGPHCIHSEGHRLCATVLTIHFSREQSHDSTQGHRRFLCMPPYTHCTDLQLA